MAEPVAAPLVGYRWYRIGAGGALAGAQGVVWPDDAPLHAEHHTTPEPGWSATDTAPLPAALWAAAHRIERLGVIALVIETLAGAALLVGWWPPTFTAAALAVLAWQTVHRRRPLAAATIRTAAATLGLLAGSLALSVGWLVALVVARSKAQHWVAAGQIAVAVAVCAVAVITAAAVLSIVYRPAWLTRHHQCPAPPRRFLARWVPECGIHAYHHLADAVAAADRDAGGVPIVVARVLLWGTVYPYQHGWRAEWSRIEALYDTGDGNVEISAARYRLLVHAYPAGTRHPRRHDSVEPQQPPRWEARARAWAARRTA